jgi:CheY-like chemotaxis protein
VFRILVVDDSQDSADTLAELLRLEGYATQAAYGGAEALLTADVYRPHLVVLDFRMGDVDGIQAASVLGSQYSHVRLIAVTAVSLVEWGKRLADAGIDAALQKPVDPPELFRTVRKLLGADRG